MDSGLFCARPDVLMQKAIAGGIEEFMILVDRDVSKEDVLGCISRIASIRTGAREEQ